MGGVFELAGALGPSKVIHVYEPSIGLKGILVVDNMAKGPRLILALAPCPTGWDFDPQETVQIGKLAVKSGIWPLKEYSDGKVVHTKVPARRVPVERYLERQGRFAHLFHPERDEELLTQMQQRVDAYWERVET